MQWQENLHDNNKLTTVSIITDKESIIIDKENTTARNKTASGRTTNDGENFREGSEENGTISILNGAMMARSQT